MIVYRHVTTFGVTEQRWLSNLTDLEIVEADGRLLLVAANQVRGGISTYAISDPAAPITMLRTRPYLADFTYQGPPQITAIHMGGDTLIHVGQMGGASNLGVTLRGDIGAMSTFGWLFGTSLGPQVTALGQVDTGQAQVLYSAQGGGLTLTTHRMGADGALVRAGQATIATPAGTTDANLDKITDVSVDGQRILIDLGERELHRDASGVGVGRADARAMVHGADRGTGYDVPSDVDAVQFGGPHLCGDGGDGVRDADRVPPDRRRAADHRRPCPGRGDDPVPERHRAGDRGPGRAGLRLCGRGR